MEIKNVFKYLKLLHENPLIYLNDELILQNTKLGTIVLDKNHRGINLSSSELGSLVYIEFLERSHTNGISLMELSYNSEGNQFAGCIELRAAIDGIGDDTMKRMYPPGLKLPDITWKASEYDAIPHEQLQFLLNEKDLILLNMKNTLQELKTVESYNSYSTFIIDEKDIKKSLEFTEDFYKEISHKLKEIYAENNK